MKEKEIFDYIEIIKDGKSYVGNEILNNKEIIELFNRNIMNVPTSFYKKVKSEKGLITLKFENGGVIRDLKNVSSELHQEFLSEYNRGFSQ